MHHRLGHRLLGSSPRKPEHRDYSPWSIGMAYYDQRDLFTRSSSVEDDGYGRGPARHPEEGSYAYHRDVSPSPATPIGDATLEERQAWPWLNYKEHATDDPYFVHLKHEEGDRPSHGSDGERVESERHDSFIDRVLETLHLKNKPAPEPPRRDSRILEDVELALSEREDLDSDDIEVDVHAGVVTLEGTVTDRRSKHIAEEIAEGVVGVVDVQNRLTIRHDDPSDANVAFVLPLAAFAL